MSEVDDLPFLMPSDEEMTWTVPKRPRPCRHPREFRRPLEDGGTACTRCGRDLDPARMLTGRRAAKRGKSIQRKRIEALGGRNLAGNNENWDGVGIAFSFESKSGGAFSARYWRWLSGIPVRADQTRVLIVTEAPGSGRTARSYVVVAFDDWKDLHGELK